MPCDVRKPEDVRRVVATAVERFGTITGLVNSRVRAPRLPRSAGPPDKQLRRAIDIVLHGTLEMTPRGRAAHDGRRSIVNVGTMSTREPMRGEGGYAVAKAAMASATQYLALELGEQHPGEPGGLGWLDGPGVRFYLTMTAERRDPEQEVYDDIAVRNPLGRIPTDEACAGAVLFLLSSLASEVTGAVLDVNGGEYMPA